MRSYLIDELDQDQVQVVTDALRKEGLQGGLPEIFYLPVPDEMLTDLQSEHLAECGPYVLALETGDGWVRLELLVRGLGKLRCACVSYAPADLRRFAIEYLDDFLGALGIGF